MTPSTGGTPARAVEHFASANYVHYGPMVIGSKKPSSSASNVWPGTIPYTRWSHVVAEGDFVAFVARQ